MFLLAANSIWAEENSCYKNNDCTAPQNSLNFYPCEYSILHSVDCVDGWLQLSRGMHYTACMLKQHTCSNSTNAEQIYMYICSNSICMSPWINSADHSFIVSVKLCVNAFQVRFITLTMKVCSRVRNQNDVVMEDCNQCKENIWPFITQVKKAVATKKDRWRREIKPQSWFWGHAHFCWLYYNRYAEKVAWIRACAIMHCVINAQVLYSDKLAYPAQIAGLPYNTSSW